LGEGYIEFGAVLIISIGSDSVKRTSISVSIWGIQEGEGDVQRMGGNLDGVEGRVKEK
jgi:hypothetical protein